LAPPAPRRTGSGGGKRRDPASFYACAFATYPRLATLINVAIAVKCFGVGISYLIIIGDLMPEIVEGFGWNPHTVGIFADRRFWITLGMLVVGPLSFLRKLNSLRYTSVIALSAVVYLIVVVVWGFYSERQGVIAHGVVWWRWNPIGLLRVLPVFVFAFTCHQNIFAVYNELKQNTQPRLNQVIQIAIGVAGVVYMVLGVYGYLTFGPNVLPNIIMMYRTGLVVLLGQELLVILQLFSFPLQCHPCRACLEQVLPGALQQQQSLNASQHGALLPTQYAPIANPHDSDHRYQHANTSSGSEPENDDSEVDIRTIG